MAITEQTPRKVFTATSGQTVFDYSDTFSATNSATIKVKQNNTRLDTDDYTVDVNNGTVTLDTGATTGDKIGVFRETDIERTTSFIQSGEFRTDIVSEDFDNLVRILQELNDKADRALKYAESVEVESSETELPTPELGQVLVWNSSGRIENGDC